MVLAGVGSGPALGMGPVAAVGSDPALGMGPASGLVSVDQRAYRGQSRDPFPVLLQPGTSPIENTSKARPTDNIGTARFI